MDINRTYFINTPHTVSRVVLTTARPPLPALTKMHDDGETAVAIAVRPQKGNGVEIC